jgi:hypothetical protein
MVRLLVFLLGMLTTSRSRQREAPWYDGTVPLAADGPSAAGRPVPRGEGGQQGQGAAWQSRFEGAPPGRPEAQPPWPPQPRTVAGAITQRLVIPKPPRKRRVPRWVKWALGLLVLGLIFRKALVFLVVTALSAALHLVGVNVHFPSVKFGWPWQSVSAGTTTNTSLGPWVLQKIEGISKPALGVANFSFYFTHKVSKNIGFWPCWYSSTFYAVGHASATVNLNPGPAWWRPATGHYRLQVLSRPFQGKPGHVAVTMMLPSPQLPQSVNDVTINNMPSKPIASQHSWTYPGFGCGMVIRPQFPQSVLYSQAQQIAFYKSRHAPDVTRPLVQTAETQATRTIRDNFVQPTVNAFGYHLDRFILRWSTKT